MTIRKSTTRWRHRQRTSKANRRGNDSGHVHHCRLCGCRIHPSCEICGACACEQEAA